MYFQILLFSVLQIIFTAGQSQNINGTYLYTNDPYTLKLKRFFDGTVTFTNQTHPSGARYVQTDNRITDDYSYGGRWYWQGTWQLRRFSGSKGGNDGWYEIFNSAIPGEFLTISKAGLDGGNGPHKHFLLLNPNYSPNFASDAENDKFLWSPKKYDQEDGNSNYQLINKAIPTGAVTWTIKQSKDKAYFLQLDNTKDKRYQKGGEWFSDTLFTFTDNSPPGTTGTSTPTTSTTPNGR